MLVTGNRSGVICLLMGTTSENQVFGQPVSPNYIQSILKAVHIYGAPRPECKSVKMIVTDIQMATLHYIQYIYITNL